MVSLNTYLLGFPVPNTYLLHLLIASLLVLDMVVQIQRQLLPNGGHQHLHSVLVQEQNVGVVLNGLVLN